MKYAVLLGRVLYASIFIMAAPNHFSKGTIAFAAGHGVPLAAIAVPLSGVLALLGGLSIILGYKARIGAWLLVLFLVPVTIMMHNFWAVADPMMAMTQQIMFMKNLSMLGAALLISHFGSGPLSIDKGDG
jgi:putative oxidoreductase